MQLSVNICYRGAEIPQLYLRESPLERVFKYKYLGVIFSAALSWSEHIQSISSKAKRLLGVLYRQFHRYSSSFTLTTLQIPYSVTPGIRQSSLESIPRQGHQTLEVVMKKTLPQFPSRLAQRRDHLSLYFYKLVSIFCFPEAPLIPYTQNRTTRAGSKNNLCSHLQKLFEILIFS